jgi:hypothetical protein
VKIEAIQNASDFLLVIELLSFYVLEYVESG